MRKRIIASLLLSLVLISALLSCGEPKKTEGESTTPTATMPEQTPIYDGENVGFDYYRNELSSYCTLPEGAYSGITIDMDATEEDVDGYIAKLLAEYPIELTVTDRPVKQGDTVYLYYTGYIGDVAFSGGSNASDSSPYALKIGSGAFIPGFEDALVGMIPAETTRTETKPITVTFPANYGSAELAGKEARFEIYLVCIVDGYRERESLDAAFIKNTLGFKTELTEDAAVIAAYRTDLLAQMRADIVTNYDVYLQQKLIDAVYEKIAIAGLPEGEVARYEKLYRSEITYFFNYYNSYFGNVFATVDEAARYYFGLGEDEDWEGFMTECCEEIIGENLTVWAIAKSEGIGVSDEEFWAELLSLSESELVSASAILKQTGADYIRNQVILKKVTAYLKEAATVNNGELPLTEGK